MFDDGLHRSSFNGLQMLCGLDVVCGSKDKSSDSIEPVTRTIKQHAINNKKMFYLFATEFMQIKPNTQLN